MSKVRIHNFSLLELGYNLSEHVSTQGATHFVFTKSQAN
jgi:hypothetical protein